MTDVKVIPPQRTRRIAQGEKLRSADKVERIPVKVIPTETYQRKPDWMRIRVSSSPRVQEIKDILRKHTLARSVTWATASPTPWMPPSRLIWPAPFRKCSCAMW